MSKKSAKNTPAITTPETPATRPSDRMGLGLCGIKPMRRMDFQDALLEANRDMRLTDAQLVICMNVEHPTMLALDTSYIPGIRRLYNAGKHTKHQVKPATPVPAYDGKGNPLVERAKRERPTAEPLTPEELGATGTGD